MIVASFSGHGLLDLGAYEKYLAGQMTDVVLPEEDMQKSMEIFKDYPLPKKIENDLRMQKVG